MMRARHVFRRAVLLVLLLAPATGARAATFCVANSGELSSALATAQGNGVPDTIRLVQNTYVGNFAYAGNHDLTIEGGYGVGCGGRVVNPANTILDGNFVSPSHTLALYSEQPVAFAVDGVTIRNGRALSTVDPSTMNGGGLWVIPGNTTPGGSLSLTNSTISGNQTYQDGGGVYVLKANAVILTNNTISNNSAGFGGGFYATECRRVTLIGNTFTSNSVSFGSPPPDGAGVYVDTTFPLTGESGKSTAITVRNGVFSGNVAGNNGGGIFVFASAASAATVDVSGNTFTSNQALNGGALAISNGSRLIASRNTFNANTASSNGGALALFFVDRVNLSSNLAYGNSATADGGAFYSLQQDVLTVTNNTVTGNNASSGSSFGGGLWLRLQDDADVANIYNNVIYANLAGSGAAADMAIDNNGNGNGVFSPVNLQDNDFNHATAGFFITQGGFAIPPSNLNNQNPLFVNPGAGDYRLGGGSPCIGTGNNGAPGMPGLDRDGRYRVSGAVVDMGAYENGAALAFKRRILDFDGDARTDLAVYHASSGNWYVRHSTTDLTTNVAFGGTGFTPVPGDYDADGKTDLAVYHAASGDWYVQRSTTGATTTTGFGGSGYTPVPGDYDGDGKTDLAVYHASSGLWFISQSGGGGVFSLGYGGSGYTAVPEDYDGDGKTDIAVFHPSSGLWFVRQSTTGTTFNVGYGGSGYTPLAWDFDGDGKADITVYHPPSGLWFVRQSTTASTFSLGYGGTAYTPVPAYYDADGRGDLAVYHMSTGLWFLRHSVTGSTVTVGFGGSAFTPLY